MSRIGHFAFPWNRAHSPGDLVASRGSHVASRDSFVASPGNGVASPNSFVASPGYRVTSPDLPPPVSPVFQDPSFPSPGPLHLRSRIRRSQLVSQCISVESNL